MASDYPGAAMYIKFKNKQKREQVNVWVLEKRVNEFLSVI